MLLFTLGCRHYWQQNCFLANGNPIELLVTSVASEGIHSSSDDSHRSMSWSAFSHTVFRITICQFLAMHRKSGTEENKSLSNQLLSTEQNRVSGPDGVSLAVSMPLDCLQSLGPVGHFAKRRWSGDVAKHLITHNKNYTYQTVSECFLCQRLNGERSGFFYI